VLGIAACYKNPFLNDDAMTVCERRTPSRPVPLLDHTACASRYLKDFEEVHQLGKGAFGTVFLSRSRVDGCTYAIKKSSVQSRNEVQKQALLKEVFAMAACVGIQHVVRYHSAWYDCDQLFIQMEACDGTIEGCYLKPNGPRADYLTLCTILQQIATALAGMHDRGMSHLDVKPENIYFKSEGQFRLGDFGLTHSESLMAKGSEPLEGDARYLAPEMIGLSQGCCVSLHPCDVFSLGVTLVELASGERVDRHSQPLAAVLMGKPLVLSGRMLGSPLSKMLQAMLYLRPDMRPTTTQVAHDAGLLRVPEETNDSIESPRVALDLEQRHCEGKRCKSAHYLALLPWTLLEDGTASHSATKRQVLHVTEWMQRDG